MILVAYASKYGSTREIAERIADTLNATGKHAEARPVEKVKDLSGYEAFVVGSATYFGHWLKEATEFVRRNQSALAGSPVWVFSSGPLGTEAVDADGHDVRAQAEPSDFAELTETIRPRGRHVFFGALDPAKLSFRDRLIKAMPAGDELFQEGDFRDWSEIETWASEIAQYLTKGRVDEGSQDDARS